MLGRRMACVEPAAVRAGASPASLGVAALVGTDGEAEAVAASHDDVEHARARAHDATEPWSCAVAEPAAAASSSAAGLRRGYKP